MEDDRDYEDHFILVRINVLSISNYVSVLSVFRLFDCSWSEWMNRIIEWHTVVITYQMFDEIPEWMCYLVAFDNSNSDLGEAYSDCWADYWSFKS